MKIKKLATVQMGYSFRSRLNASEDGSASWKNRKTSWHWILKSTTRNTRLAEEPNMK
jgi:hypothetical protein